MCPRRGVLTVGVKARARSGYALCARAFWPRRLAEKFRSDAISLRRVARNAGRGTVLDGGALSTAHRADFRKAVNVQSEGFARCGKPWLEIGGGEKCTFFRGRRSLSSYVISFGETGVNFGAAMSAMLRSFRVVGAGFCTPRAHLFVAGAIMCHKASKNRILYCNGDDKLSLELCFLRFAVARCKCHCRKCNLLGTLCVSDRCGCSAVLSLLVECRCQRKASLFRGCATILVFCACRIALVVALCRF